MVNHIALIVKMMIKFMSLKVNGYFTIIDHLVTF